jgi:cytoskeleton protein RodZ
MVGDNEQEISIVESLPSIGEQLRQAREAKKLTIAEVAVLLKLAKDTLTKLEADNWEQLHGRIYARGYLKNYVKFLSLPEDTLLSAFDIEYKPTETEKTGSQQHNSKTEFPWFPVIMIIIVLVITWFAYQQWQVSENEETDATSVSQWQGNELGNKQNSVDTFSTSVVEPIQKSDSDTKQISPDIPAQNIKNISEPEQQSQMESNFSKLTILNGKFTGTEYVQANLILPSSGVRS